jgi:hypothetical protein
VTGEVKNRTDWRKSIKEAKVRIGLQCHLKKKEEKERKKKKKEEEKEEEEEPSVTQSKNFK